MESVKFEELHLRDSTAIIPHIHAPSSNWGCHGLAESGHPGAS